MKINLRLFNKNVLLYKRIFKRFLSKLEKNPPKDLDKLAEVVNDAVWKEVDCLTCANCCKTMSPTFTVKDIKRISLHLDMKPKAFREKYLYLEKKDKDWMNKQQPCQFLDLSNNRCSIYEVRPADCADFPHLTKKKMVDYIHVHKQNVQYCPATFKMVEKMKALVNGI
ncbi:MAG: YkgJ family cysteine cluster protein [Chitinophagaceae bacterium]